MVIESCLSDREKPVGTVLDRSKLFGSDSTINSPFKDCSKRVISMITRIVLPMQLFILSKVFDDCIDAPERDIFKQSLRSECQKSKCFSKRLMKLGLRSAREIPHIHLYLHPYSIDNNGLNTTTTRKTK